MEELPPGAVEGSFRHAHTFMCNKNRAATFGDRGWAGRYAGGTIGMTLGSWNYSAYMDPEERRLRVHEIRVEILLQVGTDLAQTIKFSSRSIYPILEDTRALRAVMDRERLDVDRLLFDEWDEAALERCRGSWRRWFLPYREMRA